MLGGLEGAGRVRALRKRLRTQQGLDAQRLYFPKRRLEAEPRSLPTPRFVEVMARSAAAVEVILRSGRVLRVSTAIDTPTLRRLVEAFEDDVGC